MSYTYLQEQGEASLAECYSDIPVSVLSKLNLTAEKFSSNGNETESSPSSQSGMTSGHSTENHGEVKSKSFAEAFLVRTFPLLAEVLGFKGTNQDCGGKWLELSQKYDPDTHSWRTAQYSLLGGWESFSGTWPKWGMMQNGACWERIICKVNTKGTESGFLPTPQANDAKDTGPYGSKSWKNHVTRKSLLAAYVKIDGNTGKLNPNWTEWLMGWPIGWTGLEPLEMGRWLQWRQQNSNFFSVVNNNNKQQ